MTEKMMCRLILTTSYTNRRIGRLTDTCHTTVGRWRKRLSELGLNWTEVQDLTSEILVARVNPTRHKVKDYVEPDWLLVEKELRGGRMTRGLLWDEYAADTPQENRLSYREFCRRLAIHRKRFGLVMRQEHLAGEKVFTDFAGYRPFFADERGEKQFVQLFVAVLGASNYTFAKAYLTQSTSDVVRAHMDAFVFFGGVTEFLVSDNLKAVVLSRPRGAPAVINPEFANFATFVGTLVTPARPRRPKDKAKAEKGVQLVQRAIYALLRRRVFFALSELNGAIAAVVEEINAKPFRRARDQSRRSLFELIDRPALRPLPSENYEPADRVVGLKVGPDYHVPYDGSYYSVPYTEVGHKVELRGLSEAVEVWRGETRIAVYPRARDTGVTLTTPDHMPETHRKWMERTSDLTSWAGKIGESARTIVRDYPDSRQSQVRPQVLRALRDLATAVGPERFEAACARALQIGGGATSYLSIKSTLDRGLERTPTNPEESPPPKLKANIRGADHYAKRGRGQ